MFDKFYTTSSNYFGSKPSNDLKKQIDGWDRRSGYAVDLGCGQGRNAIYLAQMGFDVLALDISYAGLISLKETAKKESLNIFCVLQDVVNFRFPVNTFDLIVASTVLDHIPEKRLNHVVNGIIHALKDGGIGYISVFLNSDPGFANNNLDTPRECSDDNYSDCAAFIKHYFDRGELFALFEKNKIVQYKEKRELDMKHGVPHYHEIARLLFEKS